MLKYAYNRLKYCENDERKYESLHQFMLAMKEKTLLEEVFDQFWSLHEAHIMHYLTFSVVFGHPSYDKGVKLDFPCDPSSKGHNSLFNLLKQISKLNLDTKLSEYEAIKLVEINLTGEALKYFKTIEKLSLHRIVTKLTYKFGNFPTLTSYLNSIKEERQSYDITTIRSKINEVIFMLKIAYKQQATKSCSFYAKILIDCFITPIGESWSDIYRIISDMPFIDQLNTPPKLVILTFLLHLNLYTQYKAKFSFQRDKQAIGHQKAHNYEINCLNFTADFIMILNRQDYLLGITPLYLSD